MIVRPASPEDLPGLLPLFEAYLAFYGKTAETGEAREFLLERLRRGESLVFLGCGGEGRALGFAQVYPAFSTLSLGRLWILNDLYVSPPARGRGLGRALLRRCMEEAGKEGAKALTLKTARDNPPAQRLYEAMGWVPDSRFVSYGFRIAKG